MTDEELLSFNNSLEKKLGKESFAVIADDLGLLITKNSEAVNASKEKDAEIADLKRRNEQLTASNGELLKRVPMTKAGSQSNYDASAEADEAERNKETYNFNDAFDSHGNFKR